MEYPDIRIGHGYDVHRLVSGRALILGGVTVPFEYGLLGHSDADVLAMGLGDIGKHFPDNDPAYAGISSIVLAKKVNELLREENFTISNIDATVIAERPKLLPFIPEMKRNIGRFRDIFRPRKCEGDYRGKARFYRKRRGDGLSCRLSAYKNSVSANLNAKRAGKQKLPRTPLQQFRIALPIHILDFALPRETGILRFFIQTVLPVC